MRGARVDANQADIVKALRKIGATVQHLHTLGKGCPDILVGVSGQNLLLELKDSAKPPSARKLTPDEEKFHAEWRGQVHTVASMDEAVNFVMTYLGSGNGR